MEVGGDVGVDEMEKTRKEVEEEVEERKGRRDFCPSMGRPLGLNRLHHVQWLQPA